MTVTSFVITPRLPFPPRSGADLRCWYTVDALRKLGPVGVFGIGSEPPRSAPGEGIALWQSTSLESALDHVGETGPTSWIQVPSWRPADWYFTPEIGAEVAGAMELVDPSVLVLDSLMMARYLDLSGNGRARVVLNAHNVESDLQRQLVESETSAPAKMVRRRFAERTRLLEEETIGRVHRVWACSAADRRLLLEAFTGPPPVDVLPNVVDPKAYENAYQAHLDRQPGSITRLVFPAQFAYPPNIRAARFLIDELFPELKGSRPRVQISLVGHGPSEWMRQAAAADPSIMVTGSVDDVLPYLEDADVMVLPLFEGSGTRLKALEAMAAGLPMVATPKAVEGLGLEPGRHFLAAEDVGQFVAALSDLDEPETYGRLLQEGRALVEREYSPRALEVAVRRSLEALS